MSNPVDEFLETMAGHEKLAFFGAGSGKQMMGKAREVLGDPIVQAGLNVGIGAAALGGGPLLQKAYYAVTKKRDFNEMMDTNPDLAEYHEDNPKQFNQHYNSLRRLNPRFAADPVVAATYMRQMSINPGTAGKVIVESLQGARGLGGQGMFKQMPTPSVRLPSRDDGGEDDDEY